MKEYSSFNGEKDIKLQKILELASLFFKEQGLREFNQDKELKLFSPFAQEGIKQEN